ncbi:type II toxin-antitoxin system RelE/ParE family toxin [Schleiferilactobacillus shenzhenensis]|uniref:type II toxin-antitoxin system RelE/ParE family toxin n=1 Tax=Schleiferilactobacillus shenzhenensis TaxID=1231337 RepID=UPI00068C0F9C|nr:type II toxin-antitoxin system RelE/ParE family toxin [Schleiferilactobacillus shenzhenensis]
MKDGNHLVTRLAFFRSDKFKSRWIELGLTEAEYEDLITGLTDYFRHPPDNNYGRSFPGTVIEDAGGAIKYRYRTEHSNEGKSGGYRIIYLLIERNQVFFLDVYGKHTGPGKHQKENLTSKEKNAIRKLSIELRQFARRNLHDQS